MVRGRVGHGRRQAARLPVHGAARSSRQLNREQRTEMTLTAAIEASASSDRADRYPLPRRHDDLEARRERRLFARLRSGDAHARDELVARYLPLAVSTARRYERGVEPLDDLVQVASLGLVKAIDRFDPQAGTRFTSYAVPTMLGEIKRHFRDHTWSVHVPRSLNERTQTLDRVTARLTEELGRAPSVSQLCEATQLSEADVLDALQARTARFSTSLEAPARRDADGSGATIGDLIPADDKTLERAESRVTLGALLPSLSQRDREILRMRFSEDLTQREIGDRIGLSQMQVSRVLRSATETLRCAAGH